MRIQAFASIPRTDIGTSFPAITRTRRASGAHFDMPIYPLGIAVRDKFPDAQTIDPLYLSALCFDTQSREFFVGR